MIPILSIVLALFSTFFESFAKASAAHCDVKLVNSVANCVSAKSTFLTTKNLTYAGMAMSSVGGAVGVNQLRKNFADYLTQNRDELIRLGAKQGQVDWAEDWKKDALGSRKVDAEKEVSALQKHLSEGKKVVGWPGDGKNRFPPRLKEVNGVIYDIANIADENIDLLPEKFHGDNRKSAQVAIDEAIEQLKQGKPIDKKWKMKTGSKIHDAWLASNSWAKDHPIQGKSFDEMVKMSENHPDLKIRAEAKANVALDLRRIEGVSIALSEHARSKGTAGIARLALGRTASSKLGKAAAVSLGPVIGAGLLAVEIGGDTPFDPASCLEPGAQLPQGKSDSIAGQSFRVRDIINVSYSRGCYSTKPDYSADDRVLKFLISSDEEKEAALKVPEVCQFYKEMESKTCSSAKLEASRASCDYEAGSATVYLVGKNATKTKLDVSFDATGTIKNVRGPSLNGYSYNKTDDSWASYSVPVAARRGVEMPATSWLRYDSQNPMVGAQKQMFDRFESQEGWDIASNFGAIDSFVNSCVNPKSGGTTGSSHFTA